MSVAVSPGLLDLWSSPFQVLVTLRRKESLTPVVSWTALGVQLELEAEDFDEIHSSPIEKLLCFEIVR